MARHYSLKTFLRLAPNELLKQHFRVHKIVSDISWNLRGDQRIESLVKLLDTAQADTRASLEQEFQVIYAMGDSKGSDALLQEAADRHHQVDLAERFQKAKDGLERAYWTFMKYPKLFHAASDIRYAEDLGSWHTLAGLPEGAPDITEDGCKRLEERLSGYYIRKEYRGRNCHVDDYARDNSLYWFCYPEDYAESRLIFNRKSELKAQTQRPAFEIIFRYICDERSLQVHAKGRKETIRELEQVFCTTILGFDLDKYELPGPPFELDWLLDRNYRLTLQPDDPVEEVSLSGLKVRYTGKPQRRITLQTSGASDPEGVYDLLDAFVAGSASRNLLQVLRAEFRMVFRPEKEGAKPRPLNFQITAPDMCSLKYGKEHDEAKKLLKRWGLDVSGTATDNTPKRRRVAQRTLGRW